MAADEPESAESPLRPESAAVLAHPQFDTDTIITKSCDSGNARSLRCSLPLRLRRLGPVRRPCLAVRLLFLLPRVEWFQCAALHQLLLLPCARLVVRRFRLLRNERERFQLCRGLR
jgi:hypothetical protein